MCERETNVCALPGGSIEPGEDEKSAIIREIYEETGFSCDTTKPLGIICENRYHADTTRLSYYFVVHTKSQQSSLHLTEEECKLGTTVKWCSINEMIQSNSTFIASCLENSSNSFFFIAAPPIFPDLIIAQSNRILQQKITVKTCM